MFRAAAGRTLAVRFRRAGAAREHSFSEFAAAQASFLGPADMPSRRHNACPAPRHNPEPAARQAMGCGMLCLAQRRACASQNERLGTSGSRLGPCMRCVDDRGVAYASPCWPFFVQVAPAAARADTKAWTLPSARRWARAVPTIPWLHGARSGRCVGRRHDDSWRRNPPRIREH
jgi:hypothetical protein